jgi:hypothetical protein
MKNKIYILLVAIMVSISGCIENEDPTWTTPLVEFDAAIYNGPALSKTFPILTRVPGYGRAVNTATTPAGAPDPVINRSSGTVNLFVNLVGAHRTADESINISVVTAETTAVEGVHYTIPTSFTLPANSSTAIIPVTILNPGATSGSVTLVIQLDGNDAIAPSENYRRVGMSIAQN